MSRRHSREKRLAGRPSRQSLQLSGITVVSFIDTVNPLGAGNPVLSFCKIWWQLLGDRGNQSNVFCVSLKQKGGLFGGKKSTRGEGRRGIYREGDELKNNTKQAIMTYIHACVCLCVCKCHFLCCVVQMEISLLGLSIGLIVEKAHRHTAGKPVSRSKHTLFKSKGHALSAEASLWREGY